MLRKVRNQYTHYFKDEAGRRQGEYKYFFANGRLCEHFFYVNDMKHGECKEYWDDGRLSCHYFCVNGKLHGEYKSYWGNGKLFLHCFYNGNGCHGEYKSWNSDGEVFHHLFHVDNKEVSFDEVYPETEEDRMYFTLKYGVPLLPREVTC